MPTATQPILCCLGQHIAASPTQFLMERAFSANQLDWRAITVEVAPEQLERALAGGTAMKFMALRFFPNLQAPAQQQLAPQDPHLRFVGRITSARRVHQAWQAWHHWGPAILSWAGQQLDLSQTVCWLHGDSERCRSGLLGLHWLAHQAGRLPAAVIWSAAPGDVPAELWPVTHPTGATTTWQLLEASAPPAPQVAQVLERLAANGRARQVLALGDALPLTHWQPPAEIVRWCIATNASTPRAAKKTLADALWLEEAEQQVLCEAYDFYRWTGQAIPLALLSDAYDEYSAF